MNIPSQVLLFLIFSSLPIWTRSQHSSEDYLLLGNNALSSDANEEAIEFYEKGIAALKDVSESLITVLSLETNLATAFSAIGGNNEKAMEHYERAISTYKKNHSGIENKNDELEAKAITSQTAFFYGMELQEIDARRAVDMYGFAVVLDPDLWAAWANLGSVFQDVFNNFDEALQAYNKAFEILTENDNPTDPPAEPRFILSELQYRIGLCLKSNIDRDCITTAEPQKPVSCKELVAHAFSRAVQYDSENLAAKHMLASVTADATMKRASNSYVKNLFDDYAQNFEHSLVEELGYDGYARLRRGFDRAFGGRESVPIFSSVIDAGCGTGLVGEQFRNISSHMIGVDLSKVILDEAERLRPNLYNERIVGDVTEIIRIKRPVSLIVAADSFIYFGDLNPLFDSIQYGLEDEGYIAFTLENVSSEDESILEEAKPDWRWQLTASGRFAHRKKYIADVGHTHGLTVVYYENLDGFRHEHGRDVRGHLFVMKKTTNNNIDEL
mmetsp:Transcript_17991/g.41479  ORF Transcript_17991/g.41479 Transcript_17991/m.41479 type:complete len:498 (-) Transcript_17991:28-1521(-)|eukprot:CAMPEP_0197178464 /NCGR_PEP_ID=MMETSP1423-20130617/3730_1 /TAXON_ID=476441 /ORGANISM="Pseudo-nitzschia heimii, Strain UNC1101" /LENGTH=497 /DNA_ID=CAMNT_0042628211 /DNA_START=186 /DNA_END=1679 /DNA_ORIENTATION=-